MNKLKQLEEKFKKGHIKKSEYIKKMHSLHLVLWDYFDFIQGKNIKSIEISQEKIIFETKDRIKMFGNREDERIIPIEILNFGDCEADEILMARKFLKKDSIILDIGANIGWYCLSLFKNVSNGQIIAFEPASRTFANLKSNISINNAKNVKLYNFAVSDEKKERFFYYYPTESGSSSFMDLHSDIKKRIIRSKTKKIDDFIGKIVPKVDFIKCDIEGAEIFAIKGALKTIKKNLPVLLVEMLRKWSAKFEYHPNDIIKILSNIGYKCYFLRNGKLVEIKKITEKTKVTNFFFLHFQKHRRFLEKLI